MAELIPWRAVLAPLGVPGNPADRTIARTFTLVPGYPPRARIALVMHAPGGLDPLIGHVQAVTLDPGDPGALVAVGMLDPAIVWDGSLHRGRTVGDLIRAGDVVPGFDLDTLSFDSSRCVSQGRVSRVTAQLKRDAVWPDDARFELNPKR